MLFNLLQQGSQVSRNDLPTVFLTSKAPTSKPQISADSGNAGTPKFSIQSAQCLPEDLLRSHHDETREQY
mgnify:CR=1 FL=1